MDLSAYATGRSRGRNISTPLGLMMMMMMMMMMCKRFTQIPMLCVPIYNMKLAMMQEKTHIFTTFSAHTKMTAEKRGQDEVFGRIVAIVCSSFVSMDYHSFFETVA